MIDVLEQFQAAARATDEEEAAVRREANARIAVLERARAHAYRRLDFVKALDDAARSAADLPAAIAAERREILDRFGWDDFDTAPRQSIADAILPFLTAVASVHHAEAPQATDATVDPPAERQPLPLLLMAFEDWYRESFGSAFWALSDHFFPDTPLVDF